MKPKNITYLLGAGASIGCIPVVDKMRDALIEFAATIAINTNSNEDILKAKLFRDDLQWLVDESESEPSFDALARKYHHRNESKKIRLLKNLLTIFFIHRQADIRRMDKRYKSFFAKVYKEGYIHGNIKIISWNYDSQIEIAFNDLIQSNDIRSVRETMGIINKFEEDRISNSKFKVFKLNGSADFQEGNFRKLHCDLLCDQGITNDLTQLVKLYYDVSQNPRVSSNLCFAWEQNDCTENSPVVQAVKDTDVLVIIGYSFPDFNEDTDYTIIQNMTRLKEVYIQDPAYNIIKTKFAHIRSDIIPINYPYQQSFIRLKDWFNPSNFKTPSQRIENDLLNRTSLDLPNNK